MTRLKRTILTIAATLGLLAPMAVPVTAGAATTGGGTTTTNTVEINDNLNCGGALDFSDTCDATTVNDGAGSSVQTIIKNVINVISLIVGVAAVIMVIVGGLRYITSNGDSGQVGNAKNTIMYAIIGLVVVALAQVIVQFVLDRATPGTS